MQLISGVNTSGLYAFSAASAGLATNDENGNNITQTYVPNSSLEYNAVDEISGIGGSAISQYGAEKQWLTHDSTLCHVSNSAQYALGCNVPVIAEAINVSAGMVVVNITSTGNAGSMNKIVTRASADVPSGYEFMQWTHFGTNGWVGSVYAGTPTTSSTDIWGVYAASNYSTTANCKINCCYLIKKIIPQGGN